MKKNLIIIFIGLSVAMKAQKVNYTMASVSEEGGISFSQVTNYEQESVVGPVVIRSGKKLYWETSSLIAISPDGSRIAYIGDKNKARNIYFKGLNGGSSTTQSTFSGNPKLGLTFSPSGNNLAFSEKKDNSFNIYQISANGGAAVQEITSASSDENSPCYDKKGEYIYFTKSEKQVVGQRGEEEISYSRFYIWNYNLEKAIMTQYIEGFTPDIAPDNKKMLITRMNATTKDGEIWQVDLITQSPSLLMSQPKKGFSTPMYSPDGKKVLCVGTTNAQKGLRQNLDIYVFNVDGTGLTQLTFHPGDDVSPRWSPDGKAIYFISQRGSKKGQYSIWKMDYKQQ
jgi:Tol biopolymer transport system component